MKNLLILCTLSLVLFSCKRDKEEEEIPQTTPPPALNANTDVKGYGMLSKLSGIWSGPLTSTTSLGSFPEWIVDMRPISASQISSKSELDSLNDIFMSFFLALHNNEYRIAFRNGGGFAGNTRTSFLWCDSVSESGSSSYYRFVDFIQGKARSWVSLLFRNDSLYFRTYTNRYNTVSPAQLHMSWDAKRSDTTTAQAAISHFGYPQKVLAKDLTNAFSGMTESIMYNTMNDPYPETAQPYLGKTTVNISYSGSLTIAPGTQSFVMFTTQPLFSGLSFQSNNLKFRTRYIILPVDDNAYTFTYMHPGTYYAYVLHDADGNGNFSSGDHLNSPLSQTTFTLGALGQETVNISVNFTIP
jgi:hypothetical protein